MTFNTAFERSHEPNAEAPERIGLHPTALNQGYGYIYTGDNIEAIDATYIREDLLATVRKEARQEAFKDLLLVAKLNREDGAMAGGKHATGLNAEARTEIMRLMCDTGCSRSELARILGVNRVCITQMFDPARNLTLDTVERVARALGYSAHICCHEHPRRKANDY